MVVFLLLASSALAQIDENSLDTKNLRTLLRSQLSDFKTEIAFKAQERDACAELPLFSRPTATSSRMAVGGHYGPAESVSENPMPFWAYREEQLGFDRPFIVRISKDESEIVSFWAHEKTTLLRVDQLLIVADFDPKIPGSCALIAFDLSNGRRLWRSELKAATFELPPWPLDYRRLANVVSLSYEEGKIRIIGQEPWASFVEVVDAKTGQTLESKQSLYWQMSRPWPNPWLQKKMTLPSKK